MRGTGYRLCAVMGYRLCVDNFMKAWGYAQGVPFMRGLAERRHAGGLAGGIEGCDGSSAIRPGCSS